MRMSTDGIDADMSTDEKLKQEIERELPELLRSDPDFRAWVLSITSDTYADRQQTESRFDQVLAELRRDREAQSRKWAEEKIANDRKWAEQTRQWEEQDRKWAEKKAEDERKWAEQKAEDERKWAAQKAEDERKWAEQTRQWEEQDINWAEQKAEDERKWAAQKAEDERKWAAQKAEDERKWAEQTRQWEEQDRKWAEQAAEDERKWAEQAAEDERKWAEQKAEDERKWAAQKAERERDRAEQNRRWEENNAHFDRVHEEIMANARKVDRGIGALGARWGIQSERAFRDALAGILEDNFGVEVLHIDDYDDSGEVFGRPEQVELDIIIQNGQLLICELKSSIDKAGIYIFERKARFYEQRHGRKATRLIVISPMIDHRAKKVADKLGIDTYGDSLDVEAL